MQEFAPLVSTLGFPIVLVLGLGLAAWHLGRFLARRLFDEDKGLVTQMVAKHGQFLAETSGHLERQEVLAQENGKLLSSLAALQADPKGPTSTVLTNEAIIHLAEALEKIATDRGVNITDQVQAIRRRLQRA